MPPNVDLVTEAVADRTRRAIVQRLAHGPATTGQLAELFPMSRPAVSRHVRLLQAAGLITTATVGRHRWHTLDISAFEVLDEWLHQVRKSAIDAPALRRPTPRRPSTGERP